MGIAAEELQRWSYLTKNQTNTNQSKDAFYFVRGRIRNKSCINCKNSSYKICSSTLERKQQIYDKLDTKVNTSQTFYYNSSRAFTSQSKTKLDHSIQKSYKNKSKSTNFRQVNNTQQIHDPIMKEQFQGKTDVDKNYFKVLKRTNQKALLSKHNYLKYLRESLILRLEAGYMQDEVLKIEEQSEVEHSKLSTIEKKMKNYSASFDNFLSVDYRESINCVSQSNKISSLTKKLIGDLADKQRNEGKCVLDIYELEDQWKRAILSEQLLASIDKSIRTGYNDKDLKSISLFLPGSTLSATDIILGSNSTYLHKTISTVEMDFSNPMSIMELLKQLESQCIHLLLFINNLEIPNTLMSSMFQNLTVYYESEINLIQQSVQRILSVTLEIEANNKMLEERANELIDGPLKASFTGGNESTLVVEYIKQAYEGCFSQVEPNFPVTKLMGLLAEEYHSLSLQLSFWPHSQVVDCLNEYNKNLRHRMKLAYKAGRNLRELDFLISSMTKAYRPPPVKTKRKKLLARTLPPLPPKMLPAQYITITKSQYEYLHMFTDICPHSDEVASFFAYKNKAELQKWKLKDT